MPKRHYVYAISLISALLVTSLAQEPVRVAIPPIPETASAAAGFAPAGWRVEATAEGDLNGDGRPDAAIVITTGTQGYDEQAGRPLFITRALVLALREADGRLRRSAVSDSAVLDGNEGGVMGDPFEGISIERGAVVIQHYGGSRNRWSYTHRYRWQDGGWWLIGLTYAGSDTLDPEHFDRTDINLSTGLANASARGEINPRTRRRPPLVRGSYHELPVLPVERAPVLDGRITEGEWPGYSIRLNQREQVYRSAAQWQGSEQLSAVVSAVRHGENLYLRAEVTDNDVRPEDAVRLVTKAGRALAPAEMRRGESEKGYVVEARYSLRALAQATMEYADMLDQILSPDTEFSDPTGLPLEVSVEVLDAGRAGARATPIIMSTRRAGSPYSGSIRLYRLETLRL